MTVNCLCVSRNQGPALPRQASGEWVRWAEQPRGWVWAALRGLGTQGWESVTPGTSASPSSLSQSLPGRLVLGVLRVMLCL